MVEEIRKIMDEHCMLTTFYDGKLFVLEDDGLVECTNWTKKQVYDWLGY